MAENLAEVFKRVLQAMDEAGVPDDLRELAFSKGVDLACGGSPIPAKGDGSSPSEGPKDEVGPLQAIGDRLRVPMESVREVYAINGDEITLVVPTTRLPASKSQAAREIALLLAAGRQAAGVDSEWTNVEVVREMCVEFGKYDTNNFASHITSLDGICTIRGRGAGREVRVNRRGMEEAAAAVKRLGGTD